MVEEDVGGFSVAVQKRAMCIYLVVYRVVYLQCHRLSMLTWRLSTHATDFLDPRQQPRVLPPVCLLQLVSSRVEVPIRSVCPYP